MIILYLRSSLLGSLESCEQKTYLNYVLGFPDRQGKKANLGNITHKILESMARINLATKATLKTVDFEDLGKHKINKCSVEYLGKLAFDYYVSRDKENSYTDNDLELCISWAYKAIELNNGEFNPLKNNIFNIEDYFDIEIPHDWAEYEYKVGEETISGRMSVKGTVDSIIQESDSLYRILDFKTGRRSNFATGEVKDTFEKDTQLLLYYWALRNKYPDKNFYLTIYYINDGGPYDVFFDDSDYEYAEKLIRDKFEYIKSIEQPKLLSQSNQDWRCKYCCAYSKPWGDSQKSICQHMRDEILNKGMDQVNEDYLDLSVLGQYGSGGGRVK